MQEKTDRSFKMQKVFGHFDHPGLMEIPGSPDIFLSGVDICIGISVLTKNKEDADEIFGQFKDVVFKPFKCVCSADFIGSERIAGLVPNRFKYQLKFPIFGVPRSTACTIFLNDLQKLFESLVLAFKTVHPRMKEYYRIEWEVQTDSGS